MFLDRIRPFAAAVALFFYSTLWVEAAWGQVIHNASQAVQTRSSNNGEQCRLISEVCTEGKATRNINGVAVTKDCWAYQSRYECIEKSSSANNYCKPLENPKAQCTVSSSSCVEQKNGVCLRYKKTYSCDKNLKTLHNNKLPEKINELAHTHIIQRKWNYSQCSVAQNKSCSQTNETCIEGKNSKIINGVAVSAECWQKEVQYLCRNKNGDMNECLEYERNPSCRKISQTCSHKLDNGSCQIQETRYRCTEKQSATSNTCQDQDFAKAITALEVSREASRFYDPKQQQFFKGESNQCSVKLGGALNGILGGHCCKTKAEPSKFKDTAVGFGASTAVSYGVSSIASSYTYTTMFVNSAASNIGTAMASLQSTLGTSSSFSNGYLAISGQSGMGVQVAFNPVAFGAAVAVMVIQQWLQCSQDEILTAMKKNAGLCHYIGSYCNRKVRLLGICLSKKESHCCYVSKLAKIVSEEGRKQLNKGWGNAQSPRCDGFTAAELEKLDFSKMDLSEFYEEIYANMSNVTQQIERTTLQTQQSIQQGKNPRVKNYYED